MSAIGPGDWVECVGTTKDPAVQPGAVFQVADVVPAVGDCIACGENDPSGLLFAGHQRHLHESGFFWSWCPCRFRPIYRPKADFLESLLTPADAPSEREGVDA